MFPVLRHTLTLTLFRNNHFKLWLIICLHLWISSQASIITLSNSTFSDETPVNNSQLGKVQQLKKQSSKLHSPGISKDIIVQLLRVTH